MTALKLEAIQLVEQLPEEQMPSIIQYIRTLRAKTSGVGQGVGDETALTPKMKAFLELEKMLSPVSYELDYDKELAEARDEKYGYID